MFVVVFIIFVVVLINVIIVAIAIVSGLVGFTDDVFLGAAITGVNAILIIVIGTARPGDPLVLHSIDILADAPTGKRSRIAPVATGSRLGPSEQSQHLIDYHERILSDAHCIVDRVVTP